MLRLWTRLLRDGAYFISGFVPRRRDQYLFGAWQGARYADNSKYLFEYFAAHEPHLRIVWCGAADVREHLPVGANVSFVQYGSPRALWARLRSGTCFLTHGSRDVGTYNLLRRCHRIYLGHGIAIKKMGDPPSPPAPAPIEFLRTLTRRPDSYHCWATSSPEHTRKLLAENQCSLISEAHIVETGQPRLDPLFACRSNGVDTDASVAFRQWLRETLGVPTEVRLVLYMPTFRDTGTAVVSFASLSGQSRTDLNSILSDHDAWVIEKLHPADRNRPSPGTIPPTRVTDISDRLSVDTQDLLMSSDVLITDYSGCFIDYLALDRPVIHFAYDYESYRTRDRGLYFPLESIAGGDIVTDISELLESLHLALEDPTRGRERRHEIAQRLLRWEDGQSSQRTTEFIKAFSR